VQALGASFSLPSARAWFALTAENCLAFFLASSLASLVARTNLLTHPFFLLALGGSALVETFFPASGGMGFWVALGVLAGGFVALRSWQERGARRSIGAMAVLLATVGVGCLLDLGGSLMSSDDRGRLAFLGLCPTTALALGIYSRKHVLTALRNLRWERALHYVCLYFLGAWLSGPANCSLATLLVGALAVSLVWGVAVVHNDLADLHIDRISNPHRPLVTGVWSDDQYARLGLAMAALTVVGAWLVTERFAFCLMGCLFIAFVYSDPPLRLKRVPVISTALIGLASLLMALAGFVSLGSADFSAFPTGVAVLLILAVTFGANLKDVKDYEGDRLNGVHTLVTLLGLRRGQKIVGFLFAGAVLCSPPLLQKPGLWPAAFLCATLAVFIARHRPFREKHLFLLYYSYLLLLFMTGALRQAS
jgi:chlorophyll synthase